MKTLLNPRISLPPFSPKPKYCVPFLSPVKRSFFPSSPSFLTVPPKEKGAYLRNSLHFLLLMTRMSPIVLPPLSATCGNVFPFRDAVPFSSSGSSLLQKEWSRYSPRVRQLFFLLLFYLLRHGLSVFSFFLPFLTITTPP